MDRPLPRVQFAVCKALMHWFTEHYQDFTSDPDLLLLLKKFIKEEAALADSDEGKGEASSIMALKGKVSKKVRGGFSHLARCANVVGAGEERNIREHVRSKRDSRKPSGPDSTSIVRRCHLHDAR